MLRLEVKKTISELACFLDKRQLQIINIMRLFTKFTQYCGTTFFAILISFYCNTAIAQVTVGAAIDPDADAILDLKQNQDGTSDKGLLLPRVNLISPTNAFPMSQHIEGMLVYNKTDDDNNDIKPGVFYNDGTKWKRIDILPGGTGSQVLSLDNNLEPVWGNLDIPNETGVGYVMKQFAVSNIANAAQNAVFTQNAGYGITTKVHSLTPPWVKINLSSPFSVTPEHSKNRLIVTLQAMIQTNSDGTANHAGWVDFAGGVFINSRLEVVRLSQFSHTGRFSFDIFTMYLIVEDLKVGVLQNLDIGVARIDSGSRVAFTESIGIGTPASGVNNLNSFMAKPFISIQYYEDPSSSTTPN